MDHLASYKSQTSSRARRITEVVLSSLPGIRKLSFPSCPTTTRPDPETAAERTVRIGGYLISGWERRQLSTIHIASPISANEETVP